MWGAIALVVGAVVAWVAVDTLLLWLRERRPGGPATWHGRGPGTVFRSTGFEDTVPPHEVADPVGPRHPR